MAKQLTAQLDILPEKESIEKYRILSPRDYTSSSDSTPNSATPSTSTLSLLPPLPNSEAYDLKGQYEVSPKPQKERICHGRVNNLEEKVSPTWWKSLFSDSMYLKTDGDVVEDPEVTAEEVAIIERDSDIQKLLNRDRNGVPQGKGIKINPLTISFSFVSCKKQYFNLSIIKDPIRILDLCCGQGRHSLHLASTYPHLKIHGHDQSAYLINLARTRASHSNNTHNTTFTLGDCRAVPAEPQTFDLVLLLGNSFGFFAADSMDSQVLHEIFRVLKPGGRVVLDLADGTYQKLNFNPRSWEWIDDDTFVCRERCLSVDGRRLVSREVITETERGVIRDQFYQERLYTRLELCELCAGAGLSIVAASDSLTVSNEISKRQEDLGMMANRMIMTAVKPMVSDDTASLLKNSIANNIESDSHHLFQHIQNNPVKNVSSLNGDDSSEKSARNSSPSDDGTVVSNTSIPQLSPKNSQIADLSTELMNFQTTETHIPTLIVVMGDPSQACFGKLNNTWNKEDFITRQKLIDALYELGYTSKSLKVLESHPTLSLDLLRVTYSAKKASSAYPMVFNLCDEGFNNDALKELHVPSLLDMLGFSYTGAGPNCLSTCFDKGLVNRSAAVIGVPTPNEFVYTIDGGADQAKLISFPSFIKPIRGGKKR
jgi:D-alanine-D-alanine ligase